MLTRRERLRRALHHAPVDYLPTQINYTGEMGRQLAQQFGVTPAELPTRLDNHLRRVDLSYPQHRTADGKVEYDWWGAGWNTETEGYWLAEAPLAANDSLAAYPWPDPHASTLLTGAEGAIADAGGEYFIVPNLGFLLFERAWSLRGFEQFSEDLALAPNYAEELLERITVIQEILVRRFIALGIDGGYFGDDYGAQRALLFSPRVWRRLFKPRLARIFQPLREAGLPIILHSDGAIGDILPDLIEIGLTTLNPVQPEVLDHIWLQKTYGHNLTFYGGISTQTVLPHGMPDEVEAATRACVAALAPEGTGLLLAPSHRMTADIPAANVTALLAAFAALKSR